MIPSRIVLLVVGLGLVATTATAFADRTLVMADAASAGR